ncbi:MAG: hypothetical protein V7K18_23080 [Nostoc sp.]
MSRFEPLQVNWASFTRWFVVIGDGALHPAWAIAIQEKLSSES